jgi:hypothetical protein
LISNHFVAKIVAINAQCQLTVSDGHLTFTTKVDANDLNFLKIQELAWQGALKIGQNIHFVNQALSADK